MHRRTRGVVVGMLATLAVPLAGAAPGAMPPYRYFAVIGGVCERLVLAGRDHTAGCGDELVNVDFGDGRVAFAFTSPSKDGPVVTTFLGRSSTQADLRHYRLEVDAISTVTGDADRARQVAEPVSGHCAMTGDPTREPARFECTATRPEGRTIATFVSAGAPTVYAGVRGGTDPDTLAHTPRR